MAEISLEMLEKLQDTTGWPGLDALVDGLKKSGATSADLSKILGSIQLPEALATGLSKLNERLEATAVFGKKLGTDLINGLLGAADAGELATTNMALLGTKGLIALEPLIGIIPKTITGLGGIGDSGALAGAKIQSSFTTLQPVLSKVYGAIPLIGSGLLTLTEASMNGAAAAFTYQRSLVALAAQQGQLNLVVDDSTKKFKDLGGMYEDMIVLTYRSAQATGQSVESMTGLAMTMGSIPDALATPIELAGKSMNQLVLTSQLATAFMMDQSVVAQQLGNMYTELGVKGEDAFLTLANIYAKAGDSKLRFDSFNETVMNIAKSFKMLGDNTEAATNVVKAFDTAFKSSDISPAAMQQVILGLTSGVQQMDIATSSFVSAQTGGPGGLAGGYEIELAKSEGRMDEVLQRTMQALQGQFGGSPLTLKDAASDQNLAGEFYKQSQFIQSFLGVSKDESYRVLEGMKNGALDLLAQGVGKETGTIGQDTALDHAVARGSAEQARTMDPMIGLQQDMELARALQNKQYATAQQTLSAHLHTNELLMARSAGSGTVAAMYGDTAPKEYAGIKADDILTDKLEDGKDMFAQVMKSTGLAESVQDMQKSLVGKKQDTEFSEPVGARLGPSSGLAPFASGLAPDATIPASFGTVAEAGPGAGRTGTGASPTQFELTSDPVVVQVEFGEPFRQAVKQEVQMQLKSSPRGVDQEQILRGAR